MSKLTPRACLYDTEHDSGMTSFQNEFCSRVKFVQHSHDKIDRLSLRNSCSHGFHARSDMHVQLAPDYMICDFQTGTKFVSAYIDTRMKFRTRSRISFGLKTRMNSLQNDWYENDCHFGIMSTNTEK